MSDGQSSGGSTGAMSVQEMLADANRLWQSGKRQEAERRCDDVLRCEPENIGALRLLAITATEDARFVIAEGLLKRIVRLAPDDAAAAADLGRFLYERDKYPEAIAFLERARSTGPDDPELNLLLGNLYGIVGRHEPALDAYDRCLAVQPENQAALIGRGHMLRIAGRKADAAKDYRRCTRQSPDNGPAWWYLASLAPKTLTDDDVGIMQRALESDGLPEEVRVALHFALARAMETREAFTPAWQHYEQGNALKRALVKYDPVRSEVDQQKIESTFTDALMRGARAPTPEDITPIFIVGMPRSGSTLIEQILASHSLVEGTGELPYILTLTKTLRSRKTGSLHYTEVMGALDAPALAELGSAYLQQAASHCEKPAPYLTDKMPANFPHVGLIRRILPHAKIIDARRSPLATCVANYRQLFAQGKNQSYDLTEIADYYVRYVRMMAHWDAVMPGEVLRVQYEDVVADLETQVRRLLEYCGLPFEAACIEFHESKRPVNTASSEQVREPIFTSGVDFWKNYEPRLDELKDILAPVL